MTDMNELEARIEALELLAAGKVKLDDIPLAALQRKLEQNWRPDASVMLNGTVTPALLAPIPYCSLRRAANQTIATGATTAAVMQSAVEDTDTMFDSVNGRIKIYTPGIYLCTFSAYWVDNAAGRRFWFVTKNGTTIGRETRVPNGDNPGASAVGVVRCAAGDYVSGLVNQNCGANLDIVNDVGNASVVLTATWQGN